MNHIDVMILLMIAWVIVVPSKWLVAKNIAWHVEQDRPSERWQFAAPTLLGATSPLGLSGDLYSLLLSGRHRSLNAYHSPRSGAFVFAALVCWAHVLISATIVAVPLWYYLLYPALADIYSRA